MENELQKECRDLIVKLEQKLVRKHSLEESELPDEEQLSFAIAGLIANFNDRLARIEKNLGIRG